MLDIGINVGLVCLFTGWLHTSLGEYCSQTKDSQQRAWGKEGRKDAHRSQMCQSHLGCSLRLLKPCRAPDTHMPAWESPTTAHSVRKDCSLWNTLTTGFCSVVAVGWVRRKVKVCRSKGTLSVPRRVWLCALSQHDSLVGPPGKPNNLVKWRWYLSAKETISRIREGEASIRVKIFWNKEVDLGLNDKSSSDTSSLWPRASLL